MSLFVKRYHFSMSQVCVVELDYVEDAKRLREEGFEAVSDLIGTRPPPPSVPGYERCTHAAAPQLRSRDITHTWLYKHACRCDVTHMWLLKHMQMHMSMGMSIMVVLLMRHPLTHTRARARMFVQMHMYVGMSIMDELLMRHSLTHTHACLCRRTCTWACPVWMSS